MTFTASDVLLKAASRIEEEGMWCRGHWHQVNDLDLDTWVALRLGHTRGLTDMARALKRAGLRVPECLQGTVASVAVALVDDFAEARRLTFAAFDLIGKKTGVTDPVSFNDQVAGSAHEVADLMRKAAG